MGKCGARRIISGTSHSVAYSELPLGERCMWAIHDSVIGKLIQGKAYSEINDAEAYTVWLVHLAMVQNSIRAVKVRTGAAKP